MKNTKSKKKNCEVKYLRQRAYLRINKVYVLNVSFILLGISNDERVLHNDTETLMVRLLGYLLQ